MKKVLLSLALASLALIGFAQSNFSINNKCGFDAPEGKNFMVIPFEGKSAHELYDMVRVNVGKTYNSPKEVMSVVEDKSISIYATADGIYKDNFFLVTGTYQSKYSLNFEFKDGKIKVDAPLLGSGMVKYSNGKFESFDDTAEELTKHLFEKNGEPKKKKLNKIKAIEGYFNNLINKLITVNNTAEEDW